MSELQYKPRLKIYKGCNGKATFDPIAFEGRSYNHWLFVKKINGYVVFNDSTYSNTTNKHQSAMRQLLEELNIKVDLFITGDTVNLNHIDETKAKDLLKQLYIDLGMFEDKASRSVKNAEQYKNQYNETLVQIETMMKVFNVSLPDEEIDELLLHWAMLDACERLEQIEKNKAFNNERKAMVKALTQDLNPIGAF